MTDTTRYGTTHDSHRVELEFDQSLMVLNRAKLFVDGELVDSQNVLYGTKELSATLADGATIVVRLHSGMVGELDRPQLKTADGWVDLLEP